MRPQSRTIRCIDENGARQRRHPQRRDAARKSGQSRQDSIECGIRINRKSRCLAVTVASVEQPITLFASLLRHHLVHLHFLEDKADLHPFSALRRLRDTMTHLARLAWGLELKAAMREPQWPPALTRLDSIFGMPIQGREEQNDAETLLGNSIARMQQLDRLAKPHL